MRNSKFIKFSIITLLPVIMSVGIFSFSSGSKIQKVDAASADPHLTYYHVSTLPTTIDLNDTLSDAIRSYYADLNGQNLSGEALLGALKPILSDGQKYFSYESNDAIWTAYEITDRDWNKSPATAVDFPGDYANGIITNYTYHVTDDYNDSRNPYIRALYVDRNFDNPMKAWSKNLGQAIYGDNPKGYYAHAQRWGGFNQEHIWAKAHGFNAAGHGGARGDLMHLWPGDGRANLMHNDNCFGYVDKSGADAKHVVFDGVSDAENYAKNNWIGTSATVPVNEYDNAPNKVFEPQDSDKGDIARAIFYMCARYNHINDNDEVTSDEPWLTISDSLDAAEPRSYTSTRTKKGVMGVMSDLLEWNRIDPVDEFEIHRNNILFNSFTYNRNPFIDFPQWADIIWGGESGVANPETDIINNSIGSEDVTVESLVITTPANKTVFRNGDKFDSTGLVVKAHYSNGSFSEVTGKAQITPVNMNVGGKHEVEIKFGGRTTSYFIEVFHEKEIFDNKSSFKDEEKISELNLGDTKITLNKSSSTYTPQFSKSGTSCLKIYSGNEITFECIHKIKQIDLRYMSGSSANGVDITYGGSGKMINATYDSDNVLRWEGSSNKVTFVPAGVQNIRQIDVLYDDGYQLTGLEVDENTLEYQKIYQLEHFDSEAGEEQQTKLNVNKIDIKAKYRDGSSKQLNFDDLSVSGFETDIIGEKNVFLVYAENGIKKQYSLSGIKVRDFANMTFTVTVSSSAMFLYGEDLNKSNFEVTVTFPGEQPATVGSSEFEISGYDKNKLGDQTLTISVGEVNNTISISVQDYIKFISVEGEYYNVYELGTEFDPEGIEIIASYAGPTEDFTLSLSQVTFSELDTSILGLQEIFVTFVDTATGRTLVSSYTVEVVEPDSLLFGCFGSVIASSSLITLMSLVGVSLLLARRKEN